VTSQAEITAAPLRREWSNVEIEKLIWLWKNVQSITTISGVLERSTSAVQTQASRRSLPKRTVSTPGENEILLTASQRAKLLDVYRRNKSGIPVTELASTIRASIETILNTVLVLSRDDPRYLARLTFPMTSGDMRECLRCRRPFCSEGRHNRICSNCKSSDDWLNDV